MPPTALVTGAAGFIGRHFTRYLRNTLGYDVTGIDLDAWGTPDVFEGDANDFFRNVERKQFDLVVHAAYHVGGRATIDGNPSVLALNLALDANMFEWAVRTRQKHVLYFSSSAVYPVELQTGKIGNRPYQLREDHACIDLPLLPDARYGWAKLTGEKLAHAAAEQDLPVTIVRPFSGYGADQSTDYPFPSFIDRALDCATHGGPFDIWGSGHQSRDWIHVDDVVRGAMEIVEDSRHNLTPTPTTVNLGTGIRTTMYELAEQICAEAGTKPDFRILHDKPLGVMERVADTSRMHAYYHHRIPLRDGIREALETRRALNETGTHTPPC